MIKNGFRSGVGGTKVTPPDRGPPMKAIDGQFNLRCNYGTYCWTHGSSVGKNHTSMICTWCAPGHKKKVTRKGTMGGSVAVKTEIETIK